MKINAVFLLLQIVCDMQATSSNDVVFENPSPVPLGGVAVFTCSATTSAIGWITDATNITQFDFDDGTLPGVLYRTSTLHVLALLENNNSNVTCQYFVGSSERTELLLIYGPPSEPGDLLSESVLDGVLVFSWSPPWAPDRVQLNYTVTVTNTNTSVVTVFTISDTNITLTRDNTTSVNSSLSSSSQCDQYVWSVTAVNPAGISGPANYTTVVFFKSDGLIHEFLYIGPTDIKSYVCVTNSHINVTFLDFSCESTNNISYTVVVGKTCNLRSSNMLKESIVIKNTEPLTTNCTTITIIAENDLGILYHSVNTSGAVDCPIPPMKTSAIGSSGLPPVYSPTPTATCTLMSQDRMSSLSPSVIGLSVAVIAAYFLGFGTAASIGFICYYFTRRSGAGASKKSTNCSQPVTQVNEAYGLLPTSIHSPLSN